MRNWLFIIALHLFSLPASGQHNTLKAHLFALPGSSPYLASAGVGYERQLTPQYALLMTLNKTVIDFSANDGSARKATALIPEYRSYFIGKKRPVENAWFGGFFTELARVRVTGGGETEPGSSYKALEHSINPGVLFGKNTDLGRNFILEGFIGAKMRFYKETEYITTNFIPETKVSTGSLLLPRAGVNLAWRF